MNNYNPPLIEFISCPENDCKGKVILNQQLNNKVLFPDNKIVIGSLKILYPSDAEKIEISRIFANFTGMQCETNITTSTCEYFRNAITLKKTSSDNNYNVLLSLPLPDDIINFIKLDRKRTDLFILIKITNKYNVDFCLPLAMTTVKVFLSKDNISGIYYSQVIKTLH